ncbi:hypothetical protein COCMIDRAFT_6720 [Bipolaris oryzae ATCC 44560]|uniref:RING-type domain-containing protein n=1 Tax=Bipolaris oryzae ATCC 44560 TaxID=930090 RepID=W6Z1M6_COCMI|nr:uncharacterized protein COCMIDRAFT_6720 [Bipolaris oryzae ATCC 44560]EUC43855.1 hypothetical protein COCMIDRAFT_6720 [Bipolaris oryzae ATCC 44560]
MSQPTYTREEFLSTFIKSATTSPHKTEECPICAEPYSFFFGQGAVTFGDRESCNHVFCESCITQWLSTEGVNSCPLCRRQLFVSDDDEEGEEEYDDDDEEEEETEEGEYAFTDEQLHELLENAWYKVFWLLEPHRQKVARGGENVSGAGDEEDEEDSPLHHSILIHAFVRILAARVDVHALNDATGLTGEYKMHVLKIVLRRIMAELVEYIESTGGRETVPEFPRDKALVWEEPLKVVMQLL